MSTTSKTPRKPGPESTLASVRERLIEAATESLLERGAELGLGHVMLSDAITATGASRATAYRSLAHDSLDPQTFLREEVMSRVLLRDSREANRDHVAAVVAAEFQRGEADFNSGDVSRRTALLRRLIRVGSEASYLAVADSTERSILTAAYGAINSQGADASADRLAQLRKGESDVVTLFAEIYSEFAQMFELQLRDDYVLDQFSTASAALVEGIAMRSLVNDHLTDIHRPTGDGGAPEPWTLFAIAFEGLFLMFFEPKNLDAPFVDLRNF